MKYDSRPFHLLQGIAGKLLLGLSPLILCTALASTAHAATYTVNSTADTPLGAGICDGSGTCTLRAAVQAANASTGVADTIKLPAGTYTLSTTGTNEDLAASGDLDIIDSVSIVAVDGSGNPNFDPSQTIIDGNGTDRVFQIMAGATASISNLTIQHGYVDADTNNNVSIGGGGGGGGIYNSGDLTLTNCVIQNNTVVSASASGAGGGGLQTTGVAGTGPNSVKTVIIRSTISNNSAPLGGGIRNFFGDTKLDLTDVYNNSATQYSGGGVQNASGSITMLRSSIRYNTALQSGGGVDNLDAMSISESSIYLNQASGIVTGGTITAGGAGGGVSNGSAGSLLLVNTTISQNQAALAGGGLYNHKDVTITNSTIYDNSVGSTGSGTEVFACGTQDSSGPASCNTGIYVDPANPSKGLLIHTNFLNTIVGNSNTADNCNGDPADLVISKGHNIETANSCGFAASGDLSNVPTTNLFIVPPGLSFNGGDLGSLWTLSISSSSPAYNKGDNTDCPDTDGRYYSRSDGSCDIGAFEYGATVSATNVLDLALDITDKISPPNNGSVQTTITFSVANKGPLQATNVVLTGSIPFQSGLNLTSLGSESNAGSCSQSATGFTCTIPSIDAYKSANFYVALLATKPMNFQVGGEVKSSEVDNYRPDNLKSITISIPTVAGSSVSGNNFAGASGGGAVDWLSLILLVPVAARKAKRRNRTE